jgi:hypothetical protein
MRFRPNALVASFIALGILAGCQSDPVTTLPPVGAARVEQERLACFKQGGNFGPVGGGGSLACVRPTRDSGKQCTRETDCEGRCLARSGTCAPLTPLFGCNDILQADGRRVTLCVD